MKIETETSLQVCPFLPTLRPVCERRDSMPAATQSVCGQDYLGEIKAILLLFSVAGSFSW
jgi:hypothetical protein